jgi:hypothetical protein
MASHEWEEALCREVHLVVTNGNGPRPMIGLTGVFVSF